MASQVKPRVRSVAFFVIVAGVFVGVALFYGGVALCGFVAGVFALDDAARQLAYRGEREVARLAQQYVASHGDV